MKTLYAIIIGLFTCVALMAITLWPHRKSTYLLVILPTEYSVEKFFTFSNSNNIRIIDEGGLKNSFIIQTEKEGTSALLKREGLNWHIDMTFVRACSTKVRSML